MENTAFFDFVINDEDEAMLLLYAQEPEPKDPAVDIDFENKQMTLIRTPQQELQLLDIPDDVLDSLQDSDKLMVCELSQEEKEDDTQIVYVYEADIIS